MNEAHEMSRVEPTPRRGGDVTLHIERLVLDGLPLPSGSAGQVQAAMQGELSRLLNESGLNDAREGARRIVRANDFQLAENIQPAAVGRQIAQSIYKALSETR